MRNTVLKNARKQSGLTQVKIADEVNISEVNYQRIERGVQEPGVYTAIRIARVLGSTVETLFGAATPDNTKEPDGNQVEKNSTAKE